MCLNPKIDTSYQDFQIAEAERARAEEAARQARVKEGMANVAAVFDGGKIGETSYQGVQPLLSQYEGAARDYYLPQLDTQVGKARDDMTYALARAGLTNSSMAGTAQADLLDQVSQQRGSILSKIASDVAGQRTALNQNRLSVEAALRSTGDQTAATDQALAALTTFRADTPELNPLGNLFAGISAGIGAAQTGYQVGQIRRSVTPTALSYNAGRNVA